MLEWSIAALTAVPAIERIIVALPAGQKAPEGTVGVAGGATRSHSVRAALQAAGDGPADEAIVVHDAARALVTPDIFDACLEALDGAGGPWDAVIAAAPVSDTIKRAGGPHHTVMETLDRTSLWAVQTPQVFRRAALASALDQPDDALAEATDDAMLVEREGGRVRVVECSRENFKITTPVDLQVAEALLAERAAA